MLQGHEETITGLWLETLKDDERATSKPICSMAASWVSERLLYSCTPPTQWTEMYTIPTVKSKSNALILIAILWYYIKHGNLSLFALWFLGLRLSEMLWFLLISNSAKQPWENRSALQQLLTNMQSVMSAKKVVKRWIDPQQNKNSAGFCLITDAKFSSCFLMFHSFI